MGVEEVTADADCPWFGKAGRVRFVQELSAAQPTSGHTTACVLCRTDNPRRLFTKAGWTFVRCTGCGLISLRPLPTPAQLAEHYEASYHNGRYADFTAAAGIREAIARDRLRLVSALVPVGPWLDVGCSTGTFIGEAARIGITAEGIELSTAAVAQARARGLSVHQGSGESFTPSRRYAAVTAFDLIEHLPDPVAFVRRVSTWLLPGGIFTLTLPNAASLAACLMRRHWYYYTPPEHVHYFTPGTIRRLLDDNGFSRIAIRRALKPMTLDYAVAQLGEFNPRLSRIAATLQVFVPGGWRSRLRQIPVGEMIVTARGASRHANVFAAA